MTEIFTDESTRVATKEKPKTKRPSMWNVVLLNDDVTPMEFVVFVLLKIFGMNTEKAQALTWQVHLEGKGIAGTYTFEVAETKQVAVMDLAKQEGYPLQVKLEEVPTG